ncbi:hypothetical protein [Streptomyces sp. Ru62]|uniref:hypothetical protein n=1 Tax=Streptomyces sp. Ru62 TaxID=2080745 RepID=UPI0011B03877|nr:hypothetical protein [Streptomyces sp. Ru62]
MSLPLSISSGIAWARSSSPRRQTVIVEVNRPDRQTRRRRGKSDAVDAKAAARAVQAGTATAIPKSGDGAIEMIRALRVASPHLTSSGLTFVGYIERNSSALSHAGTREPSRTP